MVFLLITYANFGIISPISLNEGIAMTENINKISGKRASDMLRKLSYSYPKIRHNIAPHEILKLVNKLDHCQISGKVFIDMERELYIVPVNPFEEKVVNVDRIIIACRIAKKFYWNLQDFVRHNSDFTFSEFLNSQARFQLSKQQTIEHYQKHDPSGVHSFVDIGNYDEIISLAEKPTSKEKLNEKIKANPSPETINNLASIKPLRPIIRTPSVPKAKKKKANSDTLFSETIIRKKISVYHTRSKIKGFSSDLTYENSRDIFCRRYCQLTGMLLKKYDHVKFAPSDSFSIDRINRFEGYNRANILVMCHEANQIKAALEKFNYTENIKQLKEILEETKRRVFHKFKDDPNYQFRINKVKSVDEIIKEYLKKKKEQTVNRFVLS